MINIIDFKMGNLRSVEKAFHHLGFEAAISQEPRDIPGASHLVLPGDGAFGKSMQHIREMGFEDPIREFISSGRPFLGICVGFQLLFGTSEEMGIHKGFGLFQGAVKKFPKGRKIPHMGWNQVSWRRISALSAGIPDNSYFYFVHSYYAAATDPDNILGTTDYGINFVSVAGQRNIFAVQFHPEKSQEAGLRLLKNFAEI
ncbi:MAG TPA: imidazole glycerol phosphate synthase subunit HisH [archaeon]|nr:imidazole glycerol phosphate synthase subunit HisH [archaeon]